MEVYERIMDSFDTLPLAALIEGKILAVHGGMSPDLIKLDMLNKIDRFKEIPSSGIFT